MLTIKLLLSSRPLPHGTGEKQLFLHRQGLLNSKAEGHVKSDVVETSVTKGNEPLFIL